MHSLFLYSTENSIENALILASKIGEAIDIEQGNKAYIDTVMETSFNGIIKIDKECKITAINHYVEEILNVKYTDATGMAVNKIIPEINIECVTEILRGARESYSTSIRMNGISAMLIMAPIQADDNIYGAIISVRRLELSMNSSGNIKDMLMNGFTAKYSFSSIKTSNPEYRENLELAKKYALTKSAVLITGGDMLESERIAQAIHNNSNRRTAPYISVSVNGLSDEEQMTMLFGSKNSAEADNAVKQRGVIESCNIGTVYISDIDKLSPGCQNRLLKIVNYLPVFRPDADERKRFDVKIIASAKTELLPLVREGKFREELYYCLCPFVVNVPPLKRRNEDIKAIVGNRLEDFKNKFSSYLIISDKAMEVISSHNWEGGELQLNFFCDRLFITTTKRIIDEDYTTRLLEELYPHSQNVNGEERLVVFKHPEAEELIQLLEEHRGNRTEVAKALGISTTTLWRKMKKYGLLSKYKG
ncbi:MAG: sigma 54-interacting transcriptional regulator [Clostridiales bacterium]|nr:sigma 54-interacting transcriptional regulator [Clostridiales bacterium]